MSDPVNGSRFPAGLLIDCFPLDRFVPADRRTAPPISAVDSQTALKTFLTGQDVDTPRLQGEATYGPAEDELRLLRAARLCENGHPQQAHAETLELLPYAAADRKRLVLAHLILAHAAALSGDLREAAEGCAVAHRLTDTSKAGELRVPVLCLRARVTANGRLATNHARRAVVLARTGTWKFHAHITDCP